MADITYKDQTYSVAAKVAPDLQGLLDRLAALEEESAARHAPTRPSGVAAPLSPGPDKVVGVGRDLATLSASLGQYADWLRAQGTSRANHYPTPERELREEVRRVLGRLPLFAGLVLDGDGG